MGKCQYLGPAYDPRTWYADSTKGEPPYCGCSTEPGRSYCSEHHPIVYAHGTALRRRKKEQRRRDTLEDFLQTLRDLHDELELEA